MKKVLSIVFAVVALGAIVFAAGCQPATQGGKKAGTEKKSPAVSGENDESKVLRTDVSKKQAIVDAAAKIDELRKADQPDYAEIEGIFVSELKETVGKRDAEGQTTLVADIENAIAAAKAGNDVALNGQRISKTLIRVFYLSVKHEFEEAETLFADKTEEGAFQKWDEAEAYFGGLKSAGYLKNNPELVSRVEEAFKNGRNAIAEDELLQMKLAAETIDKISIRFFVGSVLGEVDAAKGLEVAKAVEKIVEGQVFYTAVADKFEAYHPQISSALSSPQAANPDTLHTLFAQGLADKVIHEAEEVIGNWGTDKAAVVAYEASLYMEALQEVVGEKPVVDLAAIGDQLSQLETAVSASDKTQAERLSGEIIGAMNGIKSRL